MGERHGRRNSKRDASRPEFVLGRLKLEILRKKSGGGGQIRTVDAADMSRVL